MDIVNENGECLLLSWLSDELLMIIFHGLKFRECLVFASVCKRLCFIFVNCSTLWKLFLLRDLELTERGFGVILNEIKHYWVSNINIVSYRDCWIDLRTQEIFIEISQSKNCRVMRRHILIGAEFSQDVLVKNTLDRFSHKESFRILTIQQTNSAQISLLLMNECIGFTEPLLCQRMANVYQKYKNEFLIDHCTKDGVAVYWNHHMALRMVLECSALIALSNYFGLRCETSRKSFRGAMAFVSNVLERSRFLAEKFKYEIWEAFNFANVLPRRLISPPFPELFKKKY